MTPAALAARFLDDACPDHRVRGRQDHVRAMHSAMRLLAQHPGIAQHDLAVAIVLGDLATVRAAVAREGARAPIGAKGWAPLLHLTFTWLPLPASNENAIAIARVLLEAGADPNAWFAAGGSRYTPLTGAVGGGEEDRPPHPRCDELVQLLLEHGADPYDTQVVYNLGSRPGQLAWLRTIHAHTVGAGRGDDWRDPAWTMLDMGGYGCGARWFLGQAIRMGDVALAEWCLEHGAGANVPPARDARTPQRSLYEHAVETGQLRIAELLVRHGAERVRVTTSPLQALSNAALAHDAVRVTELLRANPALAASPEPLCRAAEANDAEAIRLLVEAGVSPDVADEANTRALNHAAWSGSLDAVRTLVSLGAEIDSRETRFGGTPFGNASHFQHRDVMDFLAPLTRDVWNLTYNGYVGRLREVLDEDPSGRAWTGTAGRRCSGSRRTTRSSHWRWRSC